MFLRNTLPPSSGSKSKLTRNQQIRPDFLPGILFDPEDKGGIFPVIFPPLFLHFEPNQTNNICLYTPANSGGQITGKVRLGSKYQNSGGKITGKIPKAMFLRKVGLSPNYTALQSRRPRYNNLMIPIMPLKEVPG
jgi:hypothetical protein